MAKCDFTHSTGEHLNGSCWLLLALFLFDAFLHKARQKERTQVVRCTRLYLIQCVLTEAVFLSFFPFSLSPFIPFPFPRFFIHSTAAVTVPGRHKKIK